MRVLLIFSLVFGLYVNTVTAATVEVTVLTQNPKLLITWTPDELRKLRQRGALNAQKLIFDEAAKSMELNDRADIDLVTVYGKGPDDQEKVARVPRFMIWLDAFKVSVDSKTGVLSARGAPTYLRLPLNLFEFKEINKIELSQHAFTYPGTKLKVRTNPAASRGEKLFTQKCLACHSLNRPLDPTQLTSDITKNYSTLHAKIQGLNIDARDARGLMAYAEALALEKPKVGSSK